MIELLYGYGNKNCFSTASTTPSNRSKKGMYFLIKRGRFYLSKTLKGLQRLSNSLRFFLTHLVWFNTLPSLVIYRTKPREYYLKYSLKYFTNLFYNHNFILHTHNHNFIQYTHNHKISLILFLLFQKEK